MYLQALVFSAAIGSPMSNSCMSSLKWFIRTPMSVREKKYRGALEYMSLVHKAKWA